MIAAPAAMPQPARLDAAPTPARRRREALLGSLLVCNYLIICAAKWRLGVPQELLWISHVCLPLTGLALLFDSGLLFTSTLILIFVPHVLWLTDFTAWAISGNSPLGITGYLSRAGWLMCISTAHHLYVLPLMLTLFLRKPAVDPAALPTAAALFTTLALLSRLFLPPRDNVNYAFAVLPAMQHPLIQRINDLPAAVYFPGMLLFTIFILLAPTAWVLRRLVRAPLGRRSR